MKKIEKEEENLAYEDPGRKLYHLCIVNLVIGTLYCAKGNFQVKDDVTKYSTMTSLNPLL